MSTFAERLQVGPPVLLDGGLATELERRGVVLDDRLWSAGTLRDAPAEIGAVHRAYVEAGAEVLITASYQASVEGLTAAGVTRPEALSLIGDSVTLARDAAAGAEVFVAGSIGTYGALSADGAEYRGRYGLTRDRYREHHASRMDALLEAGVDVLALETLPDLEEAAALLLLLEERGAQAWLAFACSDARTLCGGAPMREAWALAASSAAVVAAGVNCTAPRFIAELLACADGVYAGPRLCYPNRGETWDGARWTRSSPTPSDLASLAPSWLERGARLVGGCCRTGPADIGRLAAVLRAHLATPNDG